MFNYNNYYENFPRIIGRTYDRDNMAIVVYNPGMHGEVVRDIGFYYHVYFCEFFNNNIWYYIFIYLMFSGKGVFDQRGWSLNALALELNIFIAFKVIEKVFTFIIFITEYFKNNGSKLNVNGDEKNVENLNLKTKNEGKNFLYGVAENYMDPVKDLALGICGITMYKMGYYYFDVSNFFFFLEPLISVLFEIKLNLFKSSDFGIEFDSQKINSNENLEIPNIDLKSIFSSSSDIFNLYEYDQFEAIKLKEIWRVEFIDEKNGSYTIKVNSKKPFQYRLIMGKDYSYRIESVDKPLEDDNSELISLLICIALFTGFVILINYY